jgi:hypothetical protein
VINFINLNVLQNDMYFAAKLSFILSMSGKFHARSLLFKLIILKVPSN